MEQYREQMELQRESYSSRQSESSNFREILRKKDKEMNAVLDQIEVSMPYPSLCIHQVLGYNGFTYIYVTIQLCICIGVMSSYLIGGREGEESL